MAVFTLLHTHAHPTPLLKAYLRNSFSDEPLKWTLISD